jgi:hypothetical protein
METAAAAATSHLRDRPAVHRGVGLVVFRGQPGPGRQLRRPGEPADVADLGDEYRGQHRPDPGDLQERPVARMFAEPAGDEGGEQLDLEVQRLDQPPQRVDPGPGLRCQPRPGQQLLSARAEQVAHRHRHPGGGEHCVDLALQTRPQADQLGPMPHPATQLPTGGRGDPGLGQPAHPQQIGQVRRVALVVLNPPVGKHLHPQRMRQVHGRAELGEGVRGPVPAIRRLQHDLRVLAGAFHHLPQVLRVVRDPHRLQLLPGLGHPHQHRPPPMQIHPHDLPARVLFAHRGLLRRVGREHPEHRPGVHQERGPAPSSHQYLWMKIF